MQERTFSRPHPLALIAVGARTCGNEKNHQTHVIPISVAVPMCHDRAMTEYQQPKLQGHKVALMARVSPAQHRTAIEASHRAGLSMAEYIGALIDRDAGRSNKLDNREEPRLPLANSA